ncbi:MAG: hydrogenase nickel incorporation protein HypB [Lachnospiraceae bacterium]|nr:hydrogenase nickel incorporation protein HypB [Lachnospiraceae bacterium]
MSRVRTINVGVGIFEDNDRIAADVRRMTAESGTCLINVMASPGAGKTSVLLRTIAALKARYRLGVLEADIAAEVDALKMAEAGVTALQAHTGGECAMDAAMTQAALSAMPLEDLDAVFLENVGNLVCPAEQDTGADLNVEILSVPEGDDKPLKYPLMFRVCQVILINKIDTRRFFAFDDEAVTARIRALNPGAKIFFLSAKTGEGFDDWIACLADCIDAAKKV